MPELKRVKLSPKQVEATQKYKQVAAAHAAEHDKAMARYEALIGWFGVELGLPDGSPVTVSADGTEIIQTGKPQVAAAEQSKEATK